jgi:hypothetical protein
MLDQEQGIIRETDAQDYNAYFVGRLHDHNVVIACLPAGVDGLAAAATVAKDMLRTFKELRFGLLVGIGGGIPHLKRRVVSMLFRGLWRLTQCANRYKGI